MKLHRFADIKSVTEQLAETLRRSGLPDICTGFDGLPVSRKGRYITILTPSACTMNGIIHGEHTRKTVFRLELCVTILAPMEENGIRLLDYFYQKICPAMLVSGLACTQMQVSCPKPDPMLGKLSCSAVLSFFGCCENDQEPPDEEEDTL